MQMKNGICHVALALLVAVAGCGGGGGGGSGTPPGGTNPPAADRTPDEFSFAPVVNANPGEYYEVSTTISGLDDGEIVPANLGNLAVNGFALLINGVEQDIQQDGTVQNGDVVTFRLQALDTPKGVASGEFFAGEPSVSAVFEVTTKADTEAPEIAIHFPPMRATTDAPLPAILKVRGSINDDFGVKSITVNGVETTIDAAAGTWSVDYALIAGMQEIVAVVEDLAGNTAESSVTLEHVETLEGYSLGEGDIGNPGHAVLSKSPDSTILFAGRDLVKLDAQTGNRVEVLNRNSLPSNNRFRAAARLDDSRLLLATTHVGDSSDVGGLAIHDLLSGTVIPLSVQGDGKGLDQAFPVNAMAYDEANQRVYAINSSGSTIWQISADSGNREIVVAAGASGATRDIDFDPVSGSLYVGDCGIYRAPSGILEEWIASSADLCIYDLDIDALTGDAYGINGAGRGPHIFSLDLAGGTAESLFPTIDASMGPSIETQVNSGWDVDFEQRVGYLVQDGGLAYGKRFYAIDLEAGYRVIISLHR